MSGSIATNQTAQQLAESDPFRPLKQCFAPPQASLLRRLLYFLARRSYGVFLQKNYRIRHVNADFLRELKAPYVLLANHVTNEDPFIYNILCPYPIAWIIGKSIERESKFPCLLRILRCISRSKEMGDLDTIQKIRQWIDEGEVLGIFPEGQTSLSGVSHPIPEATAKLLRFLKVPVVALRNEGGYFARPRWAYRRRISRRGGIESNQWSPGNPRESGITLHYQLLFDAKQIQSAELGEINRSIQQALHYNPYETQTRCPAQRPCAAPLLDRGLREQNLAESMELLFYSCLSCRSPESLGNMRSEKMELYCAACGARWRISDDSYFLHLESSGKLAELRYSLHQYYQLQLELLSHLARQGRLRVCRPFALLRGYSAEARHLRKGGSIRESGAGNILELNEEGLKLYRNDGSLALQLPLERLFASHVFKFNIWEFHACNDEGRPVLFVVEFSRRTDSAFLLLDSLKALQEHTHV